jgi:tRNA threonylcarbamoyladenosine biosynthesis protein TsaB
VAEPSAPRLLLIETSGRAGFVAVALGGELRGVRMLAEPRRQARDLAPAAADLLREQDWRPADVQAVVIGRGPGSYTGLRVGIMSAKAFAYATGCALVAVDTFAVIADQCTDDVHRVDVLADAQQDKVYVQPYGRAGGGWQSLAPLAIRVFDEWLAGREAGAWVSGPGLHRWRPRLGVEVPVIEPERWDAGPESLLRIGLALFLAGVRADQWGLEPLYLRPSAAEQQFDARGPT